jgi:hypothetical protein
VGLAIVVKATSYALLPGALLVLVVGLLRRQPLPRLHALRLGAASAAGLLLTAGAWFVLARLLDRAAAAQVTSATSTARFNLREFLSYVWQFYLPRLPFQTDYPSVAHTIPVYDIWLKGTWAAFGWTEVVFRNRVYLVLAALTVIVVVAAGVELWRSRRSADLMIGAFLLVVAVSLISGLHWSEYSQLESGASNFNQGRYLLPLVGVAGLVLAQALRLLAPARRVLGVAAVLGGLLVLQAFSLGLVLERFYA